MEDSELESAIQNTILSVNGPQDISNNLMLYVESDVNQGLRSLNESLNNLNDIDEKLKDGWQTASNAEYLAESLEEPKYTEEAKMYISVLSNNISYIADMIKEYHLGNKNGLNLNDILYANQEEFAKTGGIISKIFGANAAYGGWKFLEGILGTVEGWVRSEERR